MGLDGTEEATGPAIGDDRGRRGSVEAAEVLGLVLMLLVVSGTCVLLIAAHRRIRPGPIAPAVVSASIRGSAEVEEPSTIPEPGPEPIPEPEPEPEPLPPIEPEVNPTAEALSRIDREREALELEVERRSRRLATLSRELEARGGLIEHSMAEAKRADRTREALAAEVERLEAELQLAALERDVLERRRDQAFRTRSEEVRNPGYAILPYRGPSGTWRRPIPVECRDGSASMEPGGLRFSMVELMGLSGRSSPFGAAIRRLSALLESQGAPGGERVEPYVLFVVRPDGIRPFYEARSALDAIGIPYGYELVDQDWEIEYPEWDDPTIWESLDASMASDPPAVTGVPDGLIGAGGPIGGGGNALDERAGDSGSIPLRPPSPSEMPEVMRSFRDLLPPEPSRNGLPGQAGSGLGGRRGPGMASRPEGPGGGIVEVEPGGVGGPGGLPRLPGEPAGSRSGSLSGSGSGSARPRLGQAIGSEVVGRNLGVTGGPDRSGAPGGGGTVGEGSAMVSPEVDRPGGGGGTGLGRRDGGSEPATGGGLGRFLGSAGGAGARATVEAGEGGAIPESGSASAGGSGERPAGQLVGEAGAGTTSDSGSGSGSTSDSGFSSGSGSGSGFGGSGRQIELVVACGRKGVTIHPGGYKIAREEIEQDEDRLVETLEAVFSTRRRQEPASAPVPNLRFLVEPGGYGLYWTARGQVALAGLGWPTSWETTEPRTFSIFGSERW